MDKALIEKLHNMAMDSAEMAVLAKRKGDLEKFSAYSKDALKHEKEAAIKLFREQVEPTRSVLFRSAGYLALDTANYVEAKKLCEYGLEGDPPLEIRRELETLDIEIARVKLDTELFIETVFTLLKGEPFPINQDELANIFDRAIKSFDGRKVNIEYAKKYIKNQIAIDPPNYSIVDEGYSPWIDKSKKTNWSYWKRYEKFLLKEETFSPKTIDKIDEITDDILDHLKDPNSEHSFDKRGMVVGHVQSGKTSNYLGLINKAADTGYKVIIVLAGMYNNLRSQTQFRIDKGFLGFDTQVERRLLDSNKWGVGNFDITPTPFPLTSSELDGDFNQSQVVIRNNGPYVFVIKKNRHILEKLIKHLASSGETIEGNKKFVKQPLLVIDDEADQASINISRENVSSINGLIRSLLSLFQKSSYVGYTATPFANVFIPVPEKFKELEYGVNVHQEEFFKKAGEDLFPKDFIINITPPSNYIGPKEVFGIDTELTEDSNEEAHGLPIVKEIDDYHGQIPNGHEHMGDLPNELPESLKDAIKCFIITCAIRRTRGDFTSHNSMMIHVTLYVRWQDRIANLVNENLNSFRRKIEYRDKDFINDLKKIWEDEYVDVTEEIISSERFDDPSIKHHDWYEIESQLYKAVSKIEVRAIHGEDDKTTLEHKNITPLDYYDRRKSGLSVIAVGGNKLSRGLTLEGLSISYYLRASKMYDTLMQMGRWFGYRPGYLDLCRIFTSYELKDWYRFITVASEDLRDDFEEMNRLRKSPKEFGLKVRQHPDVLQITATNKFRYSYDMELSFSDRLRETSRFKRDENIINKNYKHTRDFINSLGNTVQNEYQDYVWSDENNSNKVISFLEGYFREENPIENEKIVDYIRSQVEQDALVNWTICLVSTNKEKTEDLFKVNDQKISVGLTMRSDIEEGRGEYYIIAKSHIIDPKHEFIDIDEIDPRYKKALKDTITDWQLSERKNKSTEPPSYPTGRNIRKYRGVENGLLLIYPLKPNPNGWEDSNIDVPIIGYAISFPKNEDEKKVTYSVNEVFRKDYEYEDMLDD